MLSKLHSLNLKLCSKQYNKKFVLHLILAPQAVRPCQRAVYVFSYVYARDIRSSIFYKSVKDNKKFHNISPIMFDKLGDCS